MPSSRHTRFTLTLLLLASLVPARAQSDSPLRLVKTIPLPGINGRIDHMAFDPDHNHLFVAALGNNTVEVVDVETGMTIQTSHGLAEPQGVVYQPDKKRLWIANGANGKVLIFDANTFQPLKSIDLGDDADNIRRDSQTGRIYVGYGSGAIAVFDSEANKVADVKLDAHPESFQLEKSGPRIFVNLPRSRKVSVIDRTKAAVIANWTTDDAQSNFPMALDEPNGRLFIVCRKPAVLLVLDTRSGAILAKLPVIGDSDDVFYDQKRRQIYASGGEGAITVYRQLDADRYSKTAQVETLKGARTSLFVPELSRLFLAVRQEGDNAPAIRVYEPAN